MEKRIKDQLKMIFVFIPFIPVFLIGAVFALFAVHFTMGYWFMDKKLLEIYANGIKK